MAAIKLKQQFTLKRITGMNLTTRSAGYSARLSQFDSGVQSVPFYGNIKSPSGTGTPCFMRRDKFDLANRNYSGCGFGGSAPITGRNCVVFLRSTKGTQAYIPSWITMVEVVMMPVRNSDSSSVRSTGPFTLSPAA